MTLSSECVLCSLPLPKHPIVDQEMAFCCMGCHAVYKILSIHPKVEAYKETALFKQALKSGLISNPALLQQIEEIKVNLPEEEWKRVHFAVDNLWCPSCCDVIRLVLLKEKGIKHVGIDYSTDLGVIEYAPRYISQEKIFQLIKKLGYNASLLEDCERKAVSFSLYFRFAVAAFFALQIMMFSYPIYIEYFGADTKGYGLLFAWLSLASSLPIVSYSLWPILKRFFHGLRVKVFGMEALVVIGVSTAFGMSIFQLLNGSSHVYFDSLSAIVVFVLLGKIIESRAKFSAKEALIQLHRSVPRRGRKLFADGSLKFVPIKEIEVGDSMVISTGEKIVLDGVVVQGEGAVDESLMTGESMPIVKQLGAQVLAGSLLKTGAITIRVVRNAEQSMLQKMISLIEKDIGEQDTTSKTHYIRAVDQIVKWFVPAIILISLCTGLWVWLFAEPSQGTSPAEAAVLRSVAILLISCPCAIGIAAPLAESLLINALASMGAVVRNRGCLRFLGKESKVVFDKTGTLTEGKFRVLSGLDSLSQDQKAMLKGLTSQSNHPVSCAISESIEAFPVPFEKVIEFAGKGLRGETCGKFFHVGSMDFLKMQSITVPIIEPKSSQEIISEVHFAEDGVFQTTLRLGDRLKKNAFKMVELIGPARAVLLSGDSTSATKAVANLCGIPLYKSQQSPLDKREFIENLKKNRETVMMLGDGLNDAPALAVAHAGISVVSATDLSIQVSDIFLTNDRLEMIPEILKLAKKGHKVIHQNLFWAFFYNILGIALAVFGFFPPLVAALAMVLSSLIVLFNAMRLKNPKLGEMNANTF